MPCGEQDEISAIYRSENWILSIAIKGYAITCYKNEGHGVEDVYFSAAFAFVFVLSDGGDVDVEPDMALKHGRAGRSSAIFHFKGHRAGNAVIQVGNLKTGMQGMKRTVVSRPDEILYKQRP